MNAVRARSKIFIGSSSEARHLLDDLVLSLQDDLDVIPWRDYDFRMGEVALESLERALDEVDFAAFILAPDDAVRKRDEEQMATRDNVVFELGLFMGRIGRTRAFILSPGPLGGAFRIASDLFGVTTAAYDWHPRGHPNGKMAMTVAAAKIRKAVQSAGPRRRDSAVPPRVDEVLERGDTRNIASLADGAIYVVEKRFKYIDELRRRLRNHELVPSKYQYWTPEGSRYWLQLCESPSYFYHQEALRLLRQVASDVAESIENRVGTPAIDFVSLGSGDGIKDNVVLRALSKRLAKDETVYYYPIDISDTLLVEALRNAFGKGLKSSFIRAKALLGDFTKLRALEPVYEARPSPNLFSVLGNTIGNSDELEILTSIGDSMLPNDMVMIEVNIGSPGASDPLVTDPIATLSDFSPLAALGIPFDPDKFRLSMNLNTSGVPNTKSLLVEYEDVTMADGSHIDSARLAVLHHYDFASFREAVEDRLNVQTVSTYEGEGVGIMLAQRME